MTRKYNTSLPQGTLSSLLLLLLIAFSLNTLTKGASLTTPQEATQHEDAVQEQDVDDDSNSKLLNLDSKHVDKRSPNYDYVDTTDYQGYGYDTDPNSLDPGYESYLQSIQYDPMMAWGRRKRSRFFYQPKRTYGFLENPKNEAYLYHLAERRNYPKDEYMESVYMPHHFFPSFKRSFGSTDRIYNKMTKRSPTEMGARGFHEGIFTHNFGDFSPVRRKREVEKSASEDDKMTESEDKIEGPVGKNFIYQSGFVNGYPLHLNKRRFGMDASGFHGDTFNDGWGTFSTMRKRLPGFESNPYQGDQFADGYGYLNMIQKRRPEMDAAGFHGDTFSGGFGNFYTMKRRPEMDSSGFYGDTFSSGFGDFYTMKKRPLNFDGDENAHRYKRETKRRPEMTSSGFYGDTFSNGFGDFYTMKRLEAKRRPEMTSSGFYGDTFSNGFGDFYTMKKRLYDLDSRVQNEHLPNASSGEQRHEDEHKNR